MKFDMWQQKEKKKKDMWPDQDKGPTKWREGPNCKTSDNARSIEHGMRTECRICKCKQNKTTSNGGAPINYHPIRILFDN